jgi:asparagine synthase (glutamine-hydrolysing)
MCGITGYRCTGSVTDHMPEYLEAATRSLLHRGPDDGAQWLSNDRRVGLGHRRLSIIDLSDFGHQPMTSSCGQWMMVFNGEVYNFKELRTSLEALGHGFKGSGDSEVILAAFVQWGAEAVDRFIGMFAIALWHHPTQALHLIRDRLGVKPLYYGWHRGDLCFGSELKALREFKHWAPEIDREAVADYLRYGYIGHPRTIYRDIFKLPPAHRLVLHADGRLELHRYWSPLAQAGARAQQSEDDTTRELEALMVGAFSYRMIADVPVGVFLSGGVDSSLVAAILQKNSRQKIRTFTIGFDEPGFDESPHAEAVARHLGTDHTTRKLTVAEAMRILPEWGDLYDEPFADPSGIPQLMVSRVAADDVKVVLSGDGGDEMFSGYNSYDAILQRLAKLQSIPQGVRRSVAGGLGTVNWREMDEWLAARRLGGASLPIRRALTWQAIKVGERIAPQSEGRQFDLANRFFSNDELDRLLGSPTHETRPGCDVYPTDIGDKMSLWDLEHYMSEDILTKVDRATMAASIEGREPLIDHRIVEFAFSIPFEFKRGPLGAKHMLRKILYQHVPRELVERPKKGFSVPVGAWLRGPLRALPEKYLGVASLNRHGLFDSSYVKRLLARLDAGDPLAVDPVWALLAFQMWHERWMEQ